MNNKKKITSILNKSSTLVEIFDYYVKYFPKKKFLFKKREHWDGSNFEEINYLVDKISSFFFQQKIKKGDRVFILSSNRPEWVIFDLAIMRAGGITVPSFVTNNLQDNEFIIGDCKPKFVVLENYAIYKKNKHILMDISSRIILIESHKKFKSLNSIVNSNLKKVSISELKKSDVSTIIYTSGTSDNPKGVILTHNSIIHNLRAASKLIFDFGVEKERFLSFLPLSHSYEKVAGLYFPLLVGAEIYFCSSLEKLMIEIKEVKPTIFSGVPRLFENIYKKIKTNLAKRFYLNSSFLDQFFSYLENKKNFSLIKKLIFECFIKILIKKKIVDIFGGKIKVLISGGAALHPNIGYFFNNLGLPLLQGYGQTEASPLISCNTKILNAPESVGFPVENVQVRISSENEIIVKGENVMKGYWNNEKLTKQTIKNGWLQTGDLGYIDKCGRLVINGRKKDLIVTSGGDNISVSKIENLFSSQLEIEQIVIFGDNKPYLVALIVAAKNISEKQIKKLVNRLNKQVNSLEKIKKYKIVSIPFSYENGLVTQTQKLKRNKIFSHYQNVILKLYNN